MKLAYNLKRQWPVLVILGIGSVFNPVALNHAWAGEESLSVPAAPPPPDPPASASLTTSASLTPIILKQTQDSVSETSEKSIAKFFPFYPNSSAGSVLKEAMDAGQSLVKTGEETGNFRALRMGNEFRIAAGNVARTLSDPKDQLKDLQKSPPEAPPKDIEVCQCSPTQKALLSHLEWMIRRAPVEPITLDQISQLNIADLLGAVHRVRSQPSSDSSSSLGSSSDSSSGTLFLSSVRGVAQFKNRFQQPSGAYALTIEGSGLGDPNFEKNEFKVETKDPFLAESLKEGVNIPPPKTVSLQLLWDGHKIPGLEVVYHGSDQTTFLFPQSVLDPLFDLHRPIYMDLSLEVDQTISSFWGAKKHHESIPITIVLLSEYAGQVQVKVTAPDWQWVLKENALREESPDADGEHFTRSFIDGGGQSLEIVVPSIHTPPRLGDRHLVGYKATCIEKRTGACQESQLLSEDLSDDGTSAKITWAPTKDVRWALSADVETYKLVGQKLTSTTQVMRFGEALAIDTPSDAQSVSLEGLTLLNQKIEVTPPQSLPNVFELQDVITDTPGIKTYVYWIPVPMALR